MSEPFLPSIGVSFGDVDTSYTADDVTAAMGAINNHFGLIRTYDDFGGGSKYSALMNAAEAHGIDVILGVKNSELQNLSASQANATAWLNAHVYKTGTTPWSALKCILVGNETYGGAKYASDAPLLEAAVANMIAAVSANSHASDSVAVTIDFGPALHEAQNVSDCNFTGGDGSLKSSYLIGAMNAILNGGLSTPKMVFGNLYPFYAPENNVSLTTGAEMINQYAGTSSGWYPYTASLAALSNNSITGLTLNCGETGWATSGAVPSFTQDTSVELLNTYLAAMKEYLDTPSSFSGVNDFAGMTTIVFEMFDEPLKKTTSQPWEGSWGLYEAITPGSGTAPAIKNGLKIPWSR